MALPKLFVEVGAKIDEFEKKMGDVSKRLNAVDREAQRAFSGFQKIGDRLTTLGAGLTAAITLPLAAMGGAAVAASIKMDEAMDRIRAGTGATGAELQKLGDVFRNVFSKVPNTAEEVSNVVADLNTRLGITGPALADLSTQMLNLARVTGTEVGPLVASATRLFGDWSVATEKQSETLDFLFRVSQSTGIGIVRLQELVVQFGAPLRAFGFEVEEAATLMGKWEKEGVNVETVLAGLRFALGNFAKAGKEPELALRSIITQIKSAKTESEATAIAFDTFGKRAAIDMSRAIIEGRFSIEGMVEALKASGESINKAGADTLSFTERLSQLKNKATTALEPLGVGLVGAFEKLLAAAQPIIDVTAAILKQFGELGPNTQLAVIAVAALAAALGPLLLIAGQATIAIASIGPAITSLTGVMARFPTAGAFVTSTLGIIAKAAIVAAAAFAAWKLGEWLYENSEAVRKFGDGFADLLLRIPGLEAAMMKLSGVTGAQARASTDLDFATKKLEKSLADKGIVIAKTGKSAEEYAAALMKAGTAIKATGDKSEKSAAQLKADEEARRRASEVVVDYADALEKAGKRFENILRLYQQGRATLDQVTAAQIALWKAQDAADPMRPAQRFAAAWEDAGERYDKLAKEILDLSAKLKEADADLAASASKNSQDFLQAHAKIRENATKTVEIVVPLNKRLPDGLTATIKELDALAAAYERLGIKSQRELSKTVEENVKAAERIAADAGANSIVAKEAWIKVEEAKQDAARRSGEVIPEEQRKALERAQRELDAALGKQKDSHGRFAKQVSTIINDLGKDLARGTIDFFKGIFGLDGFNAKLKADSAALREELAGRTQSIEEFQRKTAEQITANEGKYAAELQKETDELRASLTDRQQAFADYVAEAGSKLEELRNKESARLADEQADLSDRLRDKEASYEEYVQEVAEKEDEIRRSHAERLQEQLSDLQRNLEDRAQGYRDFVDDANSQLGRIQSDLGETIEDATRSINRRIEDENEDYARDTEKLRDDLRKAEKKGDQEQVRVLRRSLDQRERDHSKSIRRLQEDLAEQVSDARNRAAEQTQDLKKNLDRRTRDHAEFIAETKTKQAELTASHKKQQDQQLADLHESLEKRTKDLVAFREQTALAIDAAAQRSAEKIREAEREADALIAGKQAELDKFELGVNAKIDAITAHYAQKTEEETEKLQAELAARVAEYEKYKTDVVGKLNQLELDAKGPIDRINDLLGGIATSAAEAFLRLGSEELWGGIIDGIKGALTGTAMSAAISGWISGIAGTLGAALRAVFSGGSAASNVANLSTGISDSVAAAIGLGSPSGPAGAGGSLGSAIAGQGVSAAVGAVLSGISAVSGVIGNFQMRAMNQTLDLIEESSRYTAIGTVGNFGVIDSLRTFLPFLDHINFYNYDVQKKVLGDINDALRYDVRGAIVDVGNIIRDALVPPEGAGGAMALAGFGGGGITVNFVNTTFSNRGDIDYAVNQISRNLR